MFVPTPISLRKASNIMLGFVLFILHNFKKRLMIGPHGTGANHSNHADVGYGELK